MNKIVRYMAWVLLIISALALAGCSAQAAAGQSTQGAPTLEPVKTGSSLMAEGKVVPVQSADLSFAASGVVGEVLVKEGDTVQAGQTLLRLKGSDQLASAVAEAEIDLLSAQQALDDLKTNVDLERAQANLVVADAMKELDKAQKRSYSKEYKHGDQEQIDTARANYIVAQKAAEEAEDAYSWVKDAGDENITTAGALSAQASARQQRDVALANLNYLMAKPNVLDVTQVEAQLALAQAKLADAEQKQALLKDGPNARQMALAEARLKNANTRLAAAKASLKDLDLPAPITGTIIKLDAVAGEFVQPGKVVATVVDTSSWVVETTDLAEMNIARISVGMPAMIRFDALTNYEVIGRVERIDLLGENRQGDIVYAVRLKPEQLDERLRWNMTAAVTLLEKEQK